MLYSVSDSTGPFKGFGGRKFTFQRISDNSIVESCNVWCEGDVPKHFRDRTPDNAIMLHGYGPTDMTKIKT